MKHFFIGVVWVVVIVGICVAGDQILLRYSIDSPIYGAAQTFYKDFRGRIIHLVKKENNHLEVVKEIRLPPLPSVVQEKIEPLLSREAESGGYVYTDKEGGLHLTTHLEEVPKEYRATAKPLKK